MATLASVFARPLNRTAVLCARIAFGLAALPLLVILAAFHVLAGLTWLQVAGPGAIAFTLLVWPLFTRTNQGLIAAELVSGTILGSAIMALAGWVGVLVFVPFLPAICASLISMTAASGELIREAPDIPGLQRDQIETQGGTSRPRLIS
ncbi:hypothetical protein GCM10023205_82260 [Yinghuangia aomiensis]|uniref:Fusaric acid resistance protein-like n=1 Tax=Yinghuangia aomiensis TaxID=676205 RepID=A0ABP9IGS8_9ACTN